MYGYVYISRHAQYFLFSALLAPCLALWSASDITVLRNETRALILHGFDGYMTHAFPHDELRPVTCAGRGRDPDPTNLGINDICGGFSMTLVDSLDTLAIIGDKERFSQGVRDVLGHVSFDQNSKVQVFEVSIRVLGGLLSAHQLALGISGLADLHLDWYQGELLELAVDLGRRLLPAFNTPTHIPLPRVNLRHGTGSFMPGETTITCAAGAGSLLLEFATLSRLSGIPAFEHAADKAFRALWERRLDLDLVGDAIDALTGTWSTAYTSVGAGTDSFYEYALKSWVLLNDEFYFEVWNTSRHAIATHITDPTGFLLRTIHMQNGFPLTNHVDSLSAFYPGLLVLSGDLEQATKLHLTFATLWKRFNALPERFDYVSKSVNFPVYPLRPEFVESTYFLYQATKDPYYLDLGRQILEDLKLLKTACGFAGIEDVVSGRRHDRMESFMLSETLKYLYLLFDLDHPLNGNQVQEPWVFTTEAHLLSVPARSPRVSTQRLNRSLESRQCQVPLLPSFFSAAKSRPDYYFANTKIGDTREPAGCAESREYSSTDAVSAVVKTPWVLDVFFGNLMQLFSNSKTLVSTTGKTLLIKTLKGLKLRLGVRDDELVVLQCNHQRVDPASTVLIEDDNFHAYSTESLRFAPDTRGLIKIIGSNDTGRATFLRNFGSISVGQPYQVVSKLNSSDPYGCQSSMLAYSKKSATKTALVVNEGGCRLESKLNAALSLVDVIVVVRSLQTQMLQHRQPRPGSLSCITVERDAYLALDNALTIEFLASERLWLEDYMVQNLRVDVV